MPNANISSYCIFLIVHKACDRYARKHKHTGIDSVIVSRIPETDFAVLLSQKSYKVQKKLSIL